MYAMPRASGELPSFKACCILSRAGGKVSSRSIEPDDLNHYNQLAIDLDDVALQKKLD